MAINYEENRNQCALVAWFNIENPKPGAILFHIPNGQNVGEKAGSRLKKAGLVAGIPDLFLACPSKKYHGLFIEMKSLIGRVSAHQRGIHELLRAQGYKVDVCWNWDEAKASVLDYLK